VENPDKNRWWFWHFNEAKTTVQQVVLLKTGIFAITMVFVEKQIKNTYNI
jgi:hypothetical protein